MKTYKVYIANVKVKQVADWLHEADVEGATITQGFGYWEGVLEKQVSVELSNIGEASLQAFVHTVFHGTEERALFVVCSEVHYACEVYRGFAPPTI